jgi:hypothetical protein
LGTISDADEDLAFEEAVCGLFAVRVALETRENRGDDPSAFKKLSDI